MHFVRPDIYAASCDRLVLGSIQTHVDLEPVSRRYIAGILPIRRKTLFNQSIDRSINQSNLPTNITQNSKILEIYLQIDHETVCIAIRRRTVDPSEACENVAYRY